MPMPAFASFSLRELPLPAKLVLSLFLISVGFGYFSALVQVHMQHSARDGQPMPSPDDMIEKFAGVRKAGPSTLVQPSKIEQLIIGDPRGAFDRTNMTPAFFEKSGTEYTKDKKDRGDKIVDAERDGERQALLAWVQAEPAVRKAAYTANQFARPAAQAKQPISEEFLDPKTGQVLIMSLIESRCVKCHGGDKKPDLDNYDKLEPLVTPPPPQELPGGWVKSSKQISVESLTASTHTHLLSFSMLFMLTGLIFALTTYPVALRSVLGPAVLLAQMCDIACWWLARIEGVGPTFALAILATGGLGGLGLALQILLSLF
ncbi:MAG: hypothetical protein ACRCZF_22625, partial [Gemmataceae bacterium]